ncbi:hypothetical protein quinque_009398 [Culex quinquefasciatus]
MARRKKKIVHTKSPWMIRKLLLSPIGEKTISRIEESIIQTDEADYVHAVEHHLSRDWPAQEARMTMTCRSCRKLLASFLFLLHLCGWPRNLE